MIDGDKMRLIMVDIGTGTSPDDSKFTYDDEMLEWREKAEERWEAYKEKHPHAFYHIPSELPDPEDK